MWTERKDDPQARIRREKEARTIRDFIRKKYIGLDRTILKEMDIQILIHLRSEDSKPSNGFQDYMENMEKRTLENEVKNLKNNGYNTKEELLMKFKKTYKNRYFRQVNY